MNQLTASPEDTRASGRHRSVRETPKILNLLLLFPSLLSSLLLWREDDADPTPFVTNPQEPHAFVAGRAETGELGAFKKYKILVPFIRIQC